MVDETKVPDKKPTGLVEEHKLGTVEEEAPEEGRVDVLEGKSMPVERFWRRMKKTDIQDKWGQSFKIGKKKELIKEMAEEYNKQIGTHIDPKDRRDLISKLEKEKRRAEFGGQIVRKKQIEAHLEVLKQTEGDKAV